MPIKPENRPRYPANWKTTRDQILVRACHRCECCGAPQYAVGQWLEDRFLLARAGTHYDQMQYALVYSQARESADRMNAAEQPSTPYIVIVLTIAQLDQVAENFDAANLRAWCQRCDAEYSMKNGRPARRSKKKNLELFEGEAA